MPILESGEETLVGGQAVMEGVMMRAPHSYCVAVRKPNGEIVTEEMPLARMSEKYTIFKLPGFSRRRHAVPGHEARASRRCGFRPTPRSTSHRTAKPEGSQAEGAPELGAARSTWSSRSAFFIFLYKFVPLYLVTKLASVLSGAARTASRSTAPMA